MSAHTKLELTRPAVEATDQPLDRVSMLSVETHENGSFQFVPDGKPANVLPVPGLHGRMEDIVCWFPAEPQHWWLRRLASPVLGMEEIERAEFEHLEIDAHETPEAWLEAGRRGFVVIDWAGDIQMWLPRSIPIRCASRRLASRFRKKIALPPLPIKIREPGQ